MTSKISSGSVNDVKETCAVFCIRISDEPERGAKARKADLGGAPPVEIAKLQPRMGTLEVRKRQPTAHHLNSAQRPLALRYDRSPMLSRGP